MAGSPHTSKSATTDCGKDLDPEKLGKAEDADTLVEDNDSAGKKVPLAWEVTLEKGEDPKTLAVWRKWAIVLMASSGATCVTCASSMVGAMWHICSWLILTEFCLQPAFAEDGTMKEFGISRTVAILPVSLFLIGLGTGPLVIGPLSEVYGVSCDFHSSAEH